MLSTFYLTVLRNHHPRVSNRYDSSNLPKSTYSYPLRKDKRTLFILFIEKLALKNIPFYILQLYLNPIQDSTQKQQHYNCCIFVICYLIYQSKFILFQGRILDVVSWALCQCRWRNSHQQYHSYSYQMDCPYSLLCLWQWWRWWGEQGRW